MTQRRTDNIVLCPTCEGILQLNGHLHIGQKISCRRCHSTLAVFNRKPLELVLVNESQLDDGRVKGNKNLKKDMAAGQSHKKHMAKNAQTVWAFEDDEDDDYVGYEE